MKYTIFTDPQQLIQSDFTPTLTIGFYVAGYEKAFEAICRTIQDLFPQSDIIASSSESMILPTPPHTDLHHEYPYIFISLKLTREGYRIIHCDKEGLPDEKVLIRKRYGALLFHAYSTTSQTHLEKIISHFQHHTNSNRLFGALSGAPSAIHPSSDASAEHNTTTSLYYNGHFLPPGETLLCLIDPDHYVLSGVAMHDFDPVGSEIEVTEVEHNTILEIEHKPALSAIEEICGELTQESIDAYDLPFFIRSAHTTRTSHTPLSSIKQIDRKNQSITLYKQVTKGDRLKLAIPFSREKQEFQLKKFTKYHQTDAIALLFVCIAYKGHWGDMESIYLMKICRSLDMPLIGFHTFGEVGSFTISDPSLLQNQTVTLAVLSERSGK